MQHYRRTSTRLALAVAMLGVTQLAAAQHKTWHLAEGATNAFFEEEILIANPNASAASVTVTFLKSDGAEVPVNISVPATSRYTLRANLVAGLENANASAVVTSDVDILVERSMYWPGPARRGGHNSVGVPAPAPKWYLAEGALGFFDTYILIANPSATDAAVTVTYLRTDGTTLQQQVVVPARRRETIKVNDAAPDAGEFSTVVETTNGTDIVVERAMYWNNYEGGHNAVGITTPATSWRFAEGFTGTGFNTFLLLGNPGATAANVNVTYLFDDGSAPFVQNVNVGATSRVTIDANAIPQLQDRAFSIVVDSANAVPIIAERAIYFGGFLDGAATGGLTAEATKWGFAEGLEDFFTAGGPQYESFFLLANSTANPSDVTATFYREDGTGITHTFTIPAQARVTLSGKSFPALSNQRFAAFFESTNAVPFSAERAVYWGAGRFGGHGSAGTAWTTTISAPTAAPPAATITGVTPAEANPGDFVTVTGTNLHRDSQFAFGASNAAVARIDGPTSIVVQVPNGTGSVAVGLTGPTGNGTLPNGFTFKAAPPPPPPARTPDPAPGQMLPLPNMAGIVAEVAAQFPGALRNSCQEHGGSWEFIDRVVERLRTIDARWGYNCKRGNCPDISQDVVAYHAGAGPEVNGALETYTVDVISGHCGSNPVWWWAPHAYVPGPEAARWHNRFRF